MFNPSLKLFSKIQKQYRANKVIYRIQTHFKFHALQIFYNIRPKTISSYNHWLIFINQIREESLPFYLYLSIYLP